MLFPAAQDTLSGSNRRKDQPPRERERGAVPRCPGHTLRKQPPRFSAFRSALLENPSLDSQRPSSWSCHTQLTGDEEPAGLGIPSLGAGIVLRRHLELSEAF